jgi:hypothetical protein
MCAHSSGDTKTKPLRNKVDLMEFLRGLSPDFMRRINVVSELSTFYGRPVKQKKCSLKIIYLSFSMKSGRTSPVILINGESFTYGEP